MDKSNLFMLALQMDTKFVVLRIEHAAARSGLGGSAGRLAIMDQHAADERVRLEALQESLLMVNIS